MLLLTTNVAITEPGGVHLGLAGVYALVGIFVGVFTLVGFAFMATKWMRNRGRIWDEILGVEAKKGVPARPSFAERMDSLEEKIDTITTTSQQLLRNGGSSMADTIAATATQLATMSGKLDDHISRSQKIEDELVEKGIIAALPRHK